MVTGSPVTLLRAFGIAASQGQAGTGIRQLEARLTFLGADALALVRVQLERSGTLTPAGAATSLRIEVEVACWACALLPAFAGAGTTIKLLFVGAGFYPLAFALAGVRVKGFSGGALFHPCAHAAACFGAEYLIVRAGDLAVAFTLARPEVELLVRRTYLVHTGTDAAACFRIEVLPVGTAGFVGTDTRACVVVEHLRPRTDWVRVGALTLA